jgi:quinol-cytochrome oxidoreductase complex cytochrome b subunit
MENILGSINRATDWLKLRLANIDIFDEHYANEAKTNPFYSLGAIFYLVWFLVMASGLLLIMWYIPTKTSAFDSILYIQHHIPFGNIIRGIHKYGADAMIIAATMRVYRMFLAADYKPGKEFNIAIGLITLLLSMYSGLTGYLLIWNQRAFWATKVFATFPTYMDQFIGIGDFYQPLVKSLHMGWNTAEFLLGAGGAITQETITRFFSLHLAFSLIPLIFVELYFLKTGYKRVPLSWLKRSVIIAMLVVVSIIMPAALGHRSNPDVTPLPILSDWYFLGLYQMYKYLEPVVATYITLVIPLSVILLPFIDVEITGPEKDITKRPLVLLVTIMGFLTWIIFSGLIIVNIANIHNDPPYWRDFLFLPIDIGIILQLMVFWNNPDVKQKLKMAKGAIIMGWVAIIQTVLAIAYYFMAKTEMFIDPLWHAAVYGVMRPFMGNNAETAEGLVRSSIKLSTFWEPSNWATILADSANPANKDLLLKIQSVCQQSTPFDILFQLIPTFQYTANHVAVKYHGMIDFMISNCFCFDYVKLVDRLTPGLIAANETTKYPLPVPDLDWYWMIAGPVVAIICFFAAYKFKAESKQAQTPPSPKVAQEAGVK